MTHSVLVRELLLDGSGVPPHWSGLKTWLHVWWAHSFLFLFYTFLHFNVCFLICVLFIKAPSIAMGTKIHYSDDQNLDGKHFHTQLFQLCQLQPQQWSGAWFGQALVTASHPVHLCFLLFLPWQVKMSALVKWICSKPHNAAIYCPSLMARSGHALLLRGFSDWTDPVGC